MPRHQWPSARHASHRADEHGLPPCRHRERCSTKPWVGFYIVQRLHGNPGAAGWRRLGRSRAGRQCRNQLSRRTPRHARARCDLAGPSWRDSRWDIIGHLPLSHGGDPPRPGQYSLGRSLVRPLSCRHALIQESEEKLEGTHSRAAMGPIHSLRTED
jgi:hypothetical protein